MSKWAKKIIIVVAYPDRDAGNDSKEFRLVFGSWNLEIHSVISLHIDFNYAKSIDFTTDIST